MDLHPKTSAGGIIRIGTEVIPINVIAIFVVVEHEVALKVGVQHPFPKKTVPVPVPVGRSIRPMRGPGTRFGALSGGDPEPVVVPWQGPPAICYSGCDILTRVFVIIRFKRMKDVTLLILRFRLDNDCDSIDIGVV